MFFQLLGDEDFRQFDGPVGFLKKINYGLHRWAIAFGHGSDT
jgi:hypothetical protein